MMFEDTDTDATKLFEKIQRFCREVSNIDNYQVLISGMVIAIALDNVFMH